MPKKFLQGPRLPKPEIKTEENFLKKYDSSL